MKNFEDSNRLYELAAEDPALDGELMALYEKYTEKMHSWLTSLAGSYGIQLEKDCFLLSESPEINEQRNQRMKLVGLILRKKPEEYQKFRAFSQALDAEFAGEKVQLAARYGIRLPLDEAKELSMWTGVL